MPDAEESQLTQRPEKQLVLKGLFHEMDLAFDDMYG
jgi:hypothetical protein